MKNKEIMVASGPVIIEDGKVLLNKHGEDSFWKFLGGRIEDFDFDDPLQSLEQTCIREAREENGFETEILLPLKPMMIPHPSKVDTFVVLIHFLAKRVGDTILGDDIDEFGEFDLEKIIDGEYPDEEFATNIVPVLKQYIKLKSKGIIDLL